MPLVERASLLLTAAVALMVSCGSAEGKMSAGPMNARGIFEANFLVVILLGLPADSIGEERVLEPCPNDGVNVFNQSSNSSTFLYGLSANIAAVLLFGSCTVPIKRIETGDGERHTDLLTQTSASSIITALSSQECSSTG